MTTFGVGPANPSTRKEAKAHVYRATYDDGMQTRGVRTTTVFRTPVGSHDLDIFAVSIGIVAPKIQVIELSGRGEPETDPITGIQQVTAMLEQYQREVLTTTD
jgi:hypothetical protein